VPEPTLRQLPGGVEILVPGGRPGMTSYVLLEQGDWFEPDLAFVRGFLRPGDAVVDVGACFGVYALSTAARVGAGAWQAEIGGLAYAVAPEARWKRSALDATYASALRHLAASAAAATGGASAGHLLLACETLEELCARSPTVPRLHTLARAAAAWGRRALAARSVR